MSGTMSVKIAVVGAGVVGLSSAVQIQQKMGDCVEVTMMADKFTVDTART